MEKKFRITVDGREYSVTVEDLTEGVTSFYPEPGSMSIPTPRPAVAPPPPAPTAALAAKGPAGPGDVTSTLGGIVESVPVAVGQSVNQGDKIVIIEAMKMKTPMVAPRAGKIASIAVKPGDAVEPGQVLATIS